MGGTDPNDHEFPPDLASELYRRADNELLGNDIKRLMRNAALTINRLSIRDNRPGAEFDNLVAVPREDLIRLLTGHYRWQEGISTEAARLRGEVALHAAITMWRRSGGPLSDADAALLEAFR
jgi:hypothetical protein